MSSCDTTTNAIVDDPLSMLTAVTGYIKWLLKNRMQPSAHELLGLLESELGWTAHFEVQLAVECLSINSDLTHADREYARSLLESGELKTALQEDSGSSEVEVKTGIDELIHASRAYRNSDTFKDLITFMAKFRDYAPYNNMLVRLQNPSCGFYARAKDWLDRFGRTLTEDARPMLILAPMHPVMLVYDVDQTEGPPLPEHLTRFSKFGGEFNPGWLARMIKNAEGYKIKVGTKALSSTNSGFATTRSCSVEWKMRIALHDELDDASRFGVLCHELAHILLGHLGTDKDHWWPSRRQLSHQTVEIEAEAVAYIVTTRLGLEGSSAAYVSSHLREGVLPKSVSLDLIAKVSGLVERMATESMPPKKQKKTGTKKDKAGAVAE